MRLPPPLPAVGKACGVVVGPARYGVSETLLRAGSHIFASVLVRVKLPGFRGVLRVASWWVSNVPCAAVAVVDG